MFHLIKGHWDISLEDMHDGTQFAVYNTRLKICCRWIQPMKIPVMFEIYSIFIVLFNEIKAINP